PKDAANRCQAIKWNFAVSTITPSKSNMNAFLTIYSFVIAGL
ncbi:MAG: hypothetical protein ACJAWA_000921, partial [Nonlabens sp.]